MALTVVAGDGRAWRLTQRIGGGSEGVVYAVDDPRPLVAKLVPDPPDPSAYRRRLARLVRQRREPRTVRLLATRPVRVAWPMVRVRAGALGADRVEGYLMTDMRPAYQPFGYLLTPAARRVFLPAATWATGLAAALSLARLLADLHTEGYVVGDLKPDNLWVDGHGRVGIGDVDSWQFTDGGEAFPGRMGTPGYTAPERISPKQPGPPGGGVVTGTAPDAAADDFVLAVLVHQLLMCGLHPFAGHPADGGAYLGYDDNVRHGRCRLLSRTSVLLPRSVPPDTVLPRRIVDLLRAAFGGVRPTAARWAEALAAESAPGRLRTCRVNARHVHTVERPWCPWCDLAERGAEGYPAPAARPPAGSATADRGQHRRQDRGPGRGPDRKRDGEQDQRYGRKEGPPWPG